MARTLWATDELSARNGLRDFKNKALLLTATNAAGDGPAYRIHDLLHDVARGLLTAPVTSARVDELPGLGLAFPAAHSELIERYRALASEGQWHSIPDDGYVHWQLSWHLEMARRESGIHELLREVTADGRNAWYIARERLGQVTAYFSDDLERAERLARLRSREHEGRGNIGSLLRYMLIKSSFSSLAALLPAELLAALVEKGVWQANLGLAYARQIPKKITRARALTALAPLLEGDDREMAIREAAAAVFDGEDDPARSAALAAPVERAGRAGAPGRSARGDPTHHQRVVPRSRARCAGAPADPEPSGHRARGSPRHG